MANHVLTTRALNRATLARQMLLEREKVKVAKAVERLAGMQAQVPRPPFVGLWSRVEGFRREDLIKSIEKHELLRGTLMRATLHLVTRRDFATFRAALAPDLTRITKSILGVRAEQIDLALLLREARSFFEKQPSTFAKFRLHLKSAFPALDERAMAYMVRLHVPLIQAPRSGEQWGYPTNADFALAERWLESPVENPQHELAIKYLAAFGPASIKDFQSWSGMSGGRAIIDQLRPKLRTFRDEDGRELFDLPKAPRPDADQPAPVRFLPEYDNLMLAFADRSRIIADNYRPNVTTKNLLVPATFLVDGFVAGIWKLQTEKKSVKLLTFPFSPLSKKVRSELEAEQDRLLHFIAPEE